MRLERLRMCWCDVGGMDRRVSGVIPRPEPDGFRRPGVWPFVRADLSEGGGGARCVHRGTRGTAGPRTGRGGTRAVTRPLYAVFERCLCEVCVAPVCGVRERRVSLLAERIEYRRETLSRYFYKLFRHYA